MKHVSTIALLLMTLVGSLFARPYFMADKPTIGFVTFWFDDGLKTTYTVAYPLLKDKGWEATVAMVGSRAAALEKVTADGDTVMEWDEVKQLADAGWEISNHSLTHKQISVLSGEGRYYEVVVSKQVLEQQLGVMVPSFTGPYGELGNPETVASTYEYWRTMGQGINTFPLQRELKAYFLTSTTTEEEIQGWIQEAESTNSWLIIGIHALMENPKNWQSTPAQFQMLLDKIDSSSLRVTTPYELFHMGQ